MPRLIQPNTWTLVRFPFDTESVDTLNMHSDTRPPPGGPVSNWATDDRSSLIWPSRAGWGNLFGLVQWDATGPQSSAKDGDEYRVQFERDPLSYTTTNPQDTTATNHIANTPGGQYYTVSWGLFVDPAVPVSMRVMHNNSAALNLNLAEFKLAIYY